MIENKRDQARKAAWDATRYETVDMPIEKTTEEIDASIKVQVGTFLRAWSDAYREIFDAAVAEAMHHGMSAIHVDKDGVPTAVTGFAYRGVPVTEEQFNAFMDLEGFERRL